MHSFHLFFIMFFVFTVLIFTAFFLSIVFTIRRNFKLFQVIGSANSDEAKAELEKILATINTDGKPITKTFISVTKTDNKGTISKLMETGDTNALSLMKEIVTLAEKTSETQANENKIELANTTTSGIIDDKDKKGIID